MSESKKLLYYSTDITCCDQKWIQYLLRTLVPLTTKHSFYTDQISTYLNLMTSSAKSMLITMMPMMQIMSGGDPFPCKVVVAHNSEKKVIGFAMYGIFEKIIYINYVLVDRSNRKQGVARSMLDYIRKLHLSCIGIQVKADANVETISSFIALGFDFVNSKICYTNLEDYKNGFDEILSTRCKKIFDENRNSSDTKSAVFASEVFDFSRCKDGSLKMIKMF